MSLVFGIDMISWLVIAVFVLIAAVHLFDKLRQRKNPLLVDLGDHKESSNVYTFAGRGGVFPYSNAPQRQDPIKKLGGGTMRFLEGLPGHLELNENLHDPDCDIRIVPDVSGVKQIVYCRVDGTGERCEWDNIHADHYDDFVFRARKDAETDVVIRKMQEAEIEDKMKGNIEYSLPRERRK